MAGHTSICDPGRGLVHGGFVFWFYIVTEGLPFAELKSRALINPAPLQTDDPADFSRQIRTGRPGF